MDVAMAMAVELIGFAGEGCQHQPATQKKEFPQWLTLE